MLSGWREEREVTQGGDNGADIAKSQFELDATISAVEKAAAEWGIHSDELEGRFVSALLMAIRTVGRSNVATITDLNKLIQSTHEVGSLELVKLRRLLEGADKVLAMARQGAENAVAVQVQTREQTKNTVASLAQQMAGDLLDQTHGWLLIKQRACYRREAWILAGFVSVFAFGILMAGYEARAWQDSPATEALSRCAASSFSVQIGSRPKPDRACPMEELTPRALTSLPDVVKGWFFQFILDKQAQG
jgi:hypothetical protein